MRSLGTLDILGTTYVISQQTDEENKKLSGNDGLCEFYSHEIILDCSCKNEPLNFKYEEEYYKQVLRHEIFHAIFHESGLEAYAGDEILINALASLYPKINMIMRQAENIEV